MRYTANNLRLEALAWRANQLGISYGTFSAKVSQEEANQVCKEYEALLEERRKAETERLLANSKSARKRNQKK